MANICVIGIWHQGAVVSACLADLGNKVRGVCDEETAMMLNGGHPPVYEPVLPEVIQSNIEASRLRYTADYSEGLKEAEFVFICTDTPVNTNDDSDLSSIYSIAKNIGQHIRKNFILCITSQVPVGTSENLSKVVRELTTFYGGAVAYIPEFLRLGTAVETFRQPDRIVIGCNDPNIAKRVSALYEPLNRPIFITDILSAEMAKHASNAFLATSISFINEIAGLCEAVGANALEVAEIMKLDRRIGKYAFLSPGLNKGHFFCQTIRSICFFGVTIPKIIFFKRNQREFGITADCSKGNKFLYAS